MPLEVCDPVQNLDYTIKGVKVCDFVLPQWFTGEHASGYDFLSQSALPLNILKVRINQVHRTWLAHHCF